MLIVTQRADDASVWFHLDGSSLPKWFGDAGIPEPSLRDACFLGGSSSVESGTFDGDIAEVLVYDRSLSDAERTELQHYFATKYGIEVAPPCTTCPEVLASGQGRPLYVAAYGNRVAWTNSEGGQVMSIEDATVPTAPEAVYAPGPTYARPTGVAMDATGIYWGEGQDGLHSPPFAVHRVRWSDRDHASASANGEVLGVAVADGTLYAALYSYGLSWVMEPTWIASTVPASKRLSYVAADDTHLYFSYFNATPGDDGVYRALMANLGGGSLDTDAESVATVLGPSQIVLDATHAYVVDVTLALFRVHKLSKVSELVVNDDVRWIALAPPHLFYTTADAVKRVAMMGGTPSPIAEDQPEPMGIVVVDEWLVWANSDGTIVRLPKPM